MQKSWFRAREEDGSREIIKGATRTRKRSTALAMVTGFTGRTC
jgi:hypothetical protein